MNTPIRAAAVRAADIATRASDCVGRLGQKSEAVLRAEYEVAQRTGQTVLAESIYAELSRRWRAQREAS